MFHTYFAPLSSGALEDHSQRLARGVADIGPRKEKSEEEGLTGKLLHLRG
jgi:hypothetical protein